MTKRAALLLGVLALPSCSLEAPRTPAQLVPSWRDAVTSADRDRLRDWRAAFISGLAAARRSGHGATIAQEGALLQPDAALQGGAIPNGLYRCRVIKLGAKSPGLLDYVAYPHFQCRVDQRGSVQSLAKMTGSQRYVGRIFPGDPIRQVFLGTLMLGDERRAIAYATDPQRNVAGYVEKIGAERWRLVMPRPHFESQIDVLELVPAN
jgi:hypothetical protein